MQESIFALQVISKGSFVDRDSESAYLIEVTTIRLNPEALNKWILSECMNVRECYEDGLAGDAEWTEHKEEYAERRKDWQDRIINILGINASAGSISITQAQSEVFTVVQIEEIAP